MGKIGAFVRPDVLHRSVESSRFQSLIEKLPVSVSVVRTDGTVVYANGQTEILTGYSLAEVTGRPFWLESIHPEDRWKLMGAMRRVIEGQPAVAALRFLSKRRGPRLAEMHLFASSRDEDPMIEFVSFDVTERSEVEEALFQSEALYRIFLEQSPVGMLHLDAAGTVTFENHQFRQIVGENVEDAWIGRSIFSIDGLDRRLQAAFGRMLEEGESFHDETVSFRGREARIQHLQVHGSPINHPEGGIVGGVLMIEDRTEETRRKEELQLRNRYSAAESALRKAALSNAGEVEFLDEAARIFGECTTADRVCLLLNNAAGDCCTNRARWWRPGTNEPDSLVLMQQETAVLRNLIDERGSLHVLRHGGSGAEQALLDRTGAAEAIWTPFFDESRLGGFVLLARADVTTDGMTAAWRTSELNLIEPLLRLFETLWSWILAGNRYRHITGAIADCLFNFTFDEDGERRYLFVTPQVKSLTGYSPAEIAAQGDGLVRWSDEIVHEDDRYLIDAHDDLLREGHESKTTYRVQGADGSIKWIQEHATSETDAMGDVIVSGILTDVTEQKSAEAVLTDAKQQAESANRLKSAFIATMSHEIRTPLGAVNGFAELLTRELVEHEDASEVTLPPQVVEFLQAIRENSQKLLTLVNDLFDLSNLEVGSIDLRRVSVPLHDVVMRATSKVAVPLSQKSVDLHVDLDASDPLVVGDPQRLEQVLDNLLSNAVKFTEAGSVTVRTRKREDGRVVVEVSDTGVGISPDYVDRLFEPFVQEDSRLNRQFEGSGLGLSLAKRLLDLMDGAIDVESTKGEGATFRIDLPGAERNIHGDVY